MTRIIALTMLIVALAALIVALAAAGAPASFGLSGGEEPEPVDALPPWSLVQLNVQPLQLAVYPLVRLAAAPTMAATEVTTQSMPQITDHAVTLQATAVTQTDVDAQSMPQMTDHAVTLQATAVTQTDVDAQSMPQITDHAVTLQATALLDEMTASAPRLSALIAADVHVGQAGSIGGLIRVAAAGMLTSDAVTLATGSMTLSDAVSVASRTAWVLGSRGTHTLAMAGRWQEMGLSPAAIDPPAVPDGLLGRWGIWGGSRRPTPEDIVPMICWYESAPPAPPDKPHLVIADVGLASDLSAFGRWLAANEQCMAVMMCGDRMNAFYVQSREADVQALTAAVRVVRHVRPGLPIWLTHSAGAKDSDDYTRAMVAASQPDALAVWGIMGTAPFGNERLARALLARFSPLLPGKPVYCVGTKGREQAIRAAASVAVRAGWSGLIWLDE